MEKNPLISVIIPVYNVEKYVDECIKSVVKQTYTTLEIILVNDGSEDSSGTICDKWSQKDKRIRVIHKKNGGLSDARNTGILSAHGDLIGFVDSDDIIYPTMYEQLFKIMKETNSDISCCGIDRTCLFSWKRQEKKIKEKIEIYSPEEALEAIIREKAIFVTVWNKLYKKDAIIEYLFPINKCHEDEFWTYLVIGRAKKIAQIETAYYGYRQRNDSIMKKKFSVCRLDLLDARKKRLDFFEKEYPALVSLARCDFRFECIRAFQYSLLYLEGNEKRESKDLIRSMVANNSLSYKDYKDLPIGRKIWCFGSNICFSGICWIRNWIHFGT